MGGEASTQGDVYSYGILVVEMFIGRRPTDEIFKDGFSLYNFIEKALPERLTQIVDLALLTREAETVAAMEEDNYHNEIEVAHETSYNENWIQMKENVHKCLLSVLKIGLARSLESPKDRTNIKDVTLKLQLSKDPNPTTTHGLLYALLSPFPPSIPLLHSQSPPRKKTLKTS